MRVSAGRALHSRPISYGLLVVKPGSRSTILARKLRRTEGRTDDDSRRAVDHGKRRQADRRSRSRRIPGSSWSAATRGRPTRSDATSASCAGIEPFGVTATERRRRAARAAPGLRRVQPDVAVDRRAGADPLGRRRTSSPRRRSSTAGGSGPDRKRLVDACERGGSSLFGTGISPGWAELLGHRGRRHQQSHRQDHDQRGGAHALYDSPETEKPAGFGRPIDDPNLQKMTAEGTAVFGEAVAMLADALGVELDEIVCEAEHAKTHDGPRSRLVADRGRVRRRRRGELAGPRGRPHDRRAQRALEEGGGARARLEDRGRLRHRGAGTPDGAHDAAVPSAAGLPR